MVASVPSPAGEWPLSTPITASVPAAPRARAAGRGFGLDHRVGVLLADAVVALIAAAALAPLAPVAGVALAGLWTALLGRSRGRLRGAAAVGAGTVEPVVRAGLVLSFVGLLAGSVPGADLHPASLTAYVCVVSTATLLQRSVVRSTRTRAEDHAVRVVVAGRRRPVQRMLDELRFPGSPFVVVAVCLSGAPCDDRFDVPTLHGLRHAPDAVDAHRADAVIAVPSRHLDAARLRRLRWRLEHGGTALFVGTGLCDVGPQRARVSRSGPLPLLHVQHAAGASAERVAKQAWERLAAALALLVLGPLLLVLAALVRLESPGPGLFRQTRVGRDGRTFTMLKLRTMCADAEDRLAPLTAASCDDGVLFKMRGDPRITRLGRWLRTYSLDELPQLLNVVRGEMSLVGPRPPLPREVEQYDGLARRRLAVTPGLTGLWQVSGRSDLSWEESVQLDLRYVEDWSLGLDLRILVRTVTAVVSHRGAY